MENKNSFILDKVSKYNNIEETSKENQLLLEAPTESLQILESINLTHHIHKVQKEFNEKNKVVQLKQIFNKNVYLGSDIKKLCVMYDLKCAQAQYFKGEVGVELAQIINMFIAENTITEEYTDREKIIFENEDGSKNWKWGDSEIKIKSKCNIKTAAANFFILAPAESFIKNNPKSMNATLFYREHSDSYKIDENDHLIELYSWGNNYNNIRMFNSIFHLQNHSNHNYYRSSDSKREEDLTIAGYFYITLFFIILFTGILTIINKMHIILFLNTLFSIAFLFNFLISKSNLIHFKSWNQNKY